jgi:hypothetical protein
MVVHAPSSHLGTEKCRLWKNRRIAWTTAVQPKRAAQGVLQMDLKYIIDSTKRSWIPLTVGSVLRKAKVIVFGARILGKFAPQSECHRTSLQSPGF